MSVHFLSGKPGGGKSMRAVMIVIEELRFSRRNVVTNLSLKIPELCDYLHRTYGDSFEAAQRVRILTETECFNFWLHRGNGFKIVGRREIVIEDGERKGSRQTVPDFIGHIDTMGSVLYVIDEVHKFFSARAWATNGADGFYYCSEHRKFGDDVLLVTQSINNVDKQLRSIAQDFSYRPL